MRSRLCIVLFPVVRLACLDEVSAWVGGCFRTILMLVGSAQFSSFTLLILCICICSQSVLLSVS